jgi:hypothetical protein
VVGYSKGAPDLLEMLRLYPDVRGQVAALVTIAGAVAGTRLAEGPSAGAGQALVDFFGRFPGGVAESCGIGNAQGISSLRRGVSHDRLEGYLKAGLSIPVYSLVAVSTPQTTSKVLKPSWDTLAAYSIDQDSQVVTDEGIVPGGAFLGQALGDHWAVALPFDDVRPPNHDLVLGLVDHNKPYPREALLEAVIRLVHADLRKQP